MHMEFLTEWLAFSMPFLSCFHSFQHAFIEYQLCDRNSVICRVNEVSRSRPNKGGRHRHNVYTSGDW